MKNILILAFSFLAFMNATAQIKSSVNDGTTVYYHQQKESFLSKVVKKSMAKNDQTAFLGNKLSDLKSFTNDPDPIPKSMMKKFRIEEENFEGRKSWTIKPKGEASEKVIFYVHGGGYVVNVAEIQWNFLANLVDATKATIIVFDYPLAPQNTASDTYKYLENLYSQVLEKHKGKKILFYGDSAGAGLEIAFAQYLMQTDLPQPEQVIALSPWLDISMTNPDITNVEGEDVVLEKTSLQKAGMLFAGEMDTKDPRVSPIYGDFKNLAKISIFIGTSEIFISDARKLKSKLENDGVSFNYFEYPKMIHCWALAPLKESKVAFSQIVELIKS